MRFLAVLVVLIFAAAASWKLRSSPDAAPEKVIDPRDTPRHVPAIQAGVYYLLEYVSIPTKAGTIGWTPGTALRLDEAVDAFSTHVNVSDGQHSAWVPLSSLTADAGLARRVQQADENIEESARLHTETLAGWSNAQIAAQNAAAARHIERANAEQAASSAIGVYQSRLRRGAYYSTDPAGYIGYYTELLVPAASSPSTTAAPVVQADAPPRFYAPAPSAWYGAGSVSAPSTHTPRLGEAASGTALGTGNAVVPAGTIRPGLGVSPGSVGGQAGTRPGFIAR